MDKLIGFDGVEYEVGDNVQKIEFTSSLIRYKTADVDPWRYCWNNINQHYVCQKTIYGGNN